MYNPNSFSSGEQPQEQSVDNNSDEFPSFEEHMQKIAAEENTRNLSRPSLKNEELKDGAKYMSFVVENLSEKIKDGQKLEASDIVALAKDQVFSTHGDKIKDYLIDLGINNGKDFDIRLPEWLIMKDGEEKKTPLSISFNNGEDFTRIDISKDQNGATIVSSYTGKGEEGVDVGYDGPLSIDYRVENFKSEKFE